MSLCIILLLLLKLNNIMNVCLIGYNPTNFIIALELIKKGFTIDILFEKKRKKTKTNRTIGISKNNFEYLIKNTKKISDYSWPIKKIKIFNQKNNSNESLEFYNKDKKNPTWYRTLNGKTYDKIESLTSSSPESQNIYNQSLGRIKTQIDNYVKILNKFDKN